MKKSLVLITLLFTFAVTNAQRAELKKSKIPNPKKAANSANENKSVPGEPDIDFDTRSLDLGEIDAGSSKDGVLKVYNRGQKDLIISNIRSSCGCTAAFLEKQKEPLKPGEVREMKVTLKPKPGQNKIQSVITFTCNDPAEKRVMVRTKAQTTSYFVASPKLVNFGKVLQGKVVTSNITISSKDGSPVEIVKTYCPEPSVSVSQGEKKVLKDGSQARVLEVIFDTQKRRTGNFRSYIQVTVKHPKQKIVHLQLSGNLTGEVLFTTGKRTLNVPYFDIGRVKNVKGPVPQAANRALKIKLHDESEMSNFKVLDILAEAGPLSAEAVERIPGREYELKLTNTGGFRDGMFRQKIRILVNNKTIPVYDLYLQGTIQNNFDLSSHGIYIEVAAGEPFEQTITVNQSFRRGKPFKMNVEGGKALDYAVEPNEKKGNTLYVRSAGVADTLMEEVELVDPVSGQRLPITVWVEVIKN